MSSFISELNQGILPNPNENVFTGIWNEYERVVIQSLVTSFGLDFLVHDQYGGDVDTIHNVRKLDKDSNLKYKNDANQMAYENRGTYNSLEYHQDYRYKEINRNMSQKKKDGALYDAYTGKKVSRNADIDLDHVVSAKEIHNDAGRILAGLDGKDLANCQENLKPTDRSINRSMQDKDIDDYLKNWEQKSPERKMRINELKQKSRLTDKERQELNKLETLEQIDSNKMQKENRKARKAYDAKINKAYYTSPSFISDTIAVAGSRGTEMGMRQAIGFVFVEIWVAAKEELRKVPSYSDLPDMLNAITDGIKKGVERAKAKYNEILQKFGEGFISGTLASLTTTICNIFFTTAKNLVKCIRQIMASIVEAGKVLFFNPDNLSFGERMKKVTVILATGASVLIGTVVGEMIGKTPIGMIPEIGSIVQVFCSTLVSGLLSCTFLVFLDRSKFMNKIFNFLDAISLKLTNYKEIADELERYAAELEKIDIEQFKIETSRYNGIALKIDNAKSESELNSVLLSAYETFNIKLPWEGDFNSFMRNKSNRLVFS